MIVGHKRRTIGDLDEAGELDGYHAGCPEGWRGYDQLASKARQTPCPACGRTAYAVTFMHLCARYRRPDKPRVIALSHCQCGGVAIIAEEVGS